MRILAITNRYPPHSFGSYELQCLQICHELTVRGHQIRVLTSRRADQPVNLNNSARVFRELDPYQESSRNGSFAHLYRKVRSNQRVFDQHVRRFVPDVIMMWGMEGITLSLTLSAERSGIPCVYAVLDQWLARACDADPWWRYWNSEDLSDPPLIRNILRSLRLDQAVKAQAPFGDIRSLGLEHVFFCSESLKQETSIACDLDLDRAKVVPCGIAPDEIRRKPAHSTMSGRIIYVARLSEEKDPLTAIRAIQELRRRGGDYTLDIYGRGSPQFEGTLHDYVRRYQLNGAIRFKPMLEEQVRNELHLYDILVFTSKYPEPFPLIHLKAMAARVPVISTAEGGSAELMRDGENGFVFERGNHYELADKIEHVISNPQIAERVAATAYEEAVQYYNFERVTSHIESILHQATESHGMAVA